MMKPRLLCCLFLAALCCGCNPRLSDTRDLTIANGEIVSVAVDAIDGDREIKLSASSTTAPIDVHLFLKENEEAVERMLTLGKPPENLLASAENSNQISLAATVPAGEEAIVRIQSANRQAAEVHLELSE